MPERSMEARLEAIWERHLPETRRQLAQIIDALRSNGAGADARADVEAAAASAHRLVGLASMYGRTDLAVVARRADQLLRAVDPGADEDEHERVAAELETHVP